jgi:hypothetical protein
MAVLAFAASASASESVTLKLDAGAGSSRLTEGGKPMELLCQEAETGDETSTAELASQGFSLTAAATDSANGFATGTGNVTGSGLRAVAGADSAPPPKDSANMRGVVTTEAGCDDERNSDGEGESEGAGGDDVGEQMGNASTSAPLETKAEPSIGVSTGRATVGAEKGNREEGISAPILFESETGSRFEVETTEDGRESDDAEDNDDGSDTCNIDDACFGVAVAAARAKLDSRVRENFGVDVGTDRLEPAGGNRRLSGVGASGGGVC